MDLKERTYRFVDDSVLLFMFIHFYCNANENEEKKSDKTNDDVIR